MSRLYDDIRAKGLHKGTDFPLALVVGAFNDPTPIGPGLYQDLFDQATVVAADNVSQYYYAENDKEVWLPEDFPDVVTPFPVCFIESKRPTHIMSEQHGKSEWTDQRPTRWGMLLITSKVKQGTVRPGIADALSAADPRIGNDLGKRRFLNALERASTEGGWLVHATMYFEMITGSIDCVWEAVYVVSSEGAFMPPDDEHMSDLVIPHGWVEGVVELLTINPLLAQRFVKSVAGEPITTQTVANEISGYFKPLWLGISLMHCKNVERIPNHPDRALQRSRQKKGKLPLSRYYTLRIDPVQTPGISRGKRTGTPESVEQPLRIVRGHFAFYGMPHPRDKQMRGKLFGKYAGKYWIPKHEIGTPDQGEIIKDYEVSK